MSLPMTPVFCLIAIVPVLFLLTAIMKFGWGVASRSHRDASGGGDCSTVL